MAGQERLPQRIVEQILGLAESGPSQLRPEAASGDRHIVGLYLVPCQVVPKDRPLLGRQIDQPHRLDHPVQLHLRGALRHRLVQ
jgi:hypothetical protein